MNSLAGRGASSWWRILPLALAMVAPAGRSSAAASPPDQDQITRGHAAYTASCASCHGMGLTGGGAPSLRDAIFAAYWLGSPAQVKALDVKLRTMPKGQPGSLPAQTYADIKAYILSVNNYDPGQKASRLKRSAGPSVPLPSAPASVTAASTAAPSDAELMAPADGDWPMYNRGFEGDRFSPLTQVDASNVGSLRLACVLQIGEPGSFEASPVIYQGVGYVTTTYSTVAFDAATCAKRWTYTYAPSGPEGLLNNRGVALYAGAVFRGTTDAHLISIDAVTGKLLWDVRVADSDLGYYITGAPIVLHGVVVVGLGGGDFGVPGRLYGFDAKTGRHLWTFNVIPTGKEPGAETWKSGAATGGGATWSAFGADPKDNLVLAPVGNPGPDYFVGSRLGDNLYTNSTVALDIATGKLAWYEQQRAADYHDWDTAAPPMLFEQDGRRFLAQGSKDGNVYLYDRDTRALIAKIAVTTIENPDVPLVAGKPVHACPGIGGGVEWNSPAYSPQTKALYVGSVDWCGDYTGHASDEPHTGRGAYVDGDFSFTGNKLGWIKALDAATGRELWSYHATQPVVGGITPTAGGVVLAGGVDGVFRAFDAKDGRILYSFQTGGAIGGGISAYAVGGREYIAVASGNQGAVSFGNGGSPTIMVFSLPQ